MVPPPPPSQAGRFKPRKPAKKIGTPLNSDVIGATGGIPSTQQQQQQHQRTSSSGGGRHSGGRSWNRGGGRDNRSLAGDRGGGRGYGSSGRFTLPQGQAFFTPNTSSTGGVTGYNSRGSSSTLGRILIQGMDARGNNVTAPAITPSALIARNAKLKREAAEANTSEEIVGMLDEEGIGSVPSSSIGTNKSAKANTKTLDEDLVLHENERKGLVKEIVPTFDDVYDSDTSSDDDGSNKVEHLNIQKETYKPPLKLPMPSTIRFPLNETQSQKRPLPTSPFVHPDDYEGIQFEKDNLFLVQLPTRLPPMLSTNELLSNEGNIKSEPGASEHHNQHQQLPIAAVATPSLLSHAFDNSLTSTIPGRIGKIKVYRSGKTVLVMEGPDKQPAVRILRC